MYLPRSLQGRLLVMVMGLVASVWLVTAGLTWYDVRHELDELLDSHLAQAASLLVAQRAGELEDDDHGVNAPTLHRYAPKVAFQVFHEGRLALRSSNAPGEPMLAFTGRAEDGFRTVTMGGTTWRIFATHGREQDVQVFVGEQVESRDSILWAVLRSTLAPMLFALPLLALAAWWAVRRGVAPMKVLGRALAQREPQALQPIAVDGAPSEMTPMLDALNGLFQRITELMASERRFTADAAHELRTPIAAIRTQAQVALTATDDVDRSHALQATLQGCDRAARLVEQLLTMSRLESGAAPALASVSLNAVVRQVVADLAPQALAKRQTIEVTATGSYSVEANTMLLSVLVRNLVDNAIRYSPSDAQVSVAISSTSGDVRLSVDDSGPGMIDGDRKRLGERFFRVIGSGQTGSGLGWSIAQRIARAHGATMCVARSSSLGGLSVGVKFPRGPDVKTAAFHPVRQ
ncbi:MAG: ATP-binding protein [Burkholderiaceae bacterium]